MCRMGRIQCPSGRVRKISPSAVFNPPKVQSVVIRYTDKAIPSQYTTGFTDVIRLGKRAMRNRREEMCTCTEICAGLIQSSDPLSSKSEVGLEVQELGNIRLMYNRGAILWSCMIFGPWTLFR
jgi:16S rRNA A1518/A1519 N6-dimethyltransferase RsmA/KsgA/DIM1 with predicted DNA glycosylase/AP lyase activity